MSAAGPSTIAVILPPREGFGPRRARGIGLTVRHHAMASSRQRTVVFGGTQTGHVFLDVTFRRVRALFFLPGSGRTRHTLGLIPSLRRLHPSLIEVHAEPRIALWLQRLFPTIPVVLYVHDDPAADRFIGTPAGRAAVLGRTARVVTISEWLRARFLEGVDPPPRLPVVIPPAVDMARLPSAQGTDPEVPAVAQRRTRLILFVGRLSPEKGAEQFIAACAAALPHLPGWRAEIIGAADHTVKSVETPFVRLLRAIAEPAGIALMGYRDHPDVMIAMARAAIVVVPSLTPEAGGRVVLEAMANGAAVICSGTGALPEIGGDVAVYADPTHPTELAAAIRALASDLRRLAVLGEAGRQRAAAFDLPAIGAQVEAMRAEIIAGKAPRL